MYECVKVEFKEEALGLDDYEQQEEMEKLKDLWSKGEEVTNYSFTSFKKKTYV